MADYTNLKQQIAAAIRANGEGAITGPLLQEQLQLELVLVLLQMVEEQLLQLQWHLHGHGLQLSLLLLLEQLLVAQLAEQDSCYINLLRKLKKRDKRN